MAQGQRDFKTEYQTLIDQKGQIDDSRRLHQLFDIHWTQSMYDSPESATQRGYPGQNHRWTDLSWGAIRQRQELSRIKREMLGSIDRAALTEPDQLNYDLFQRQIEDDIEGDQFPRELMPINQMSGPQQWLAETLEIMPTRTPAQCEDILARLNGIAVVIDQTIALMRKGLEAGVTPPKITMRDVPSQVWSHIADDPFQTPLLRPLQNMTSTVTQEDRERIRSTAVTTYQHKIVPAFNRLHKFLVDEYIPACRESIAWSDLPNGREWYTYLVKHYITTDLSPNQIFNIGRSEVARLRAEMDRVIESSGFEGGYAEWCEFLRTDPQFFFDDPESLVKEYRDIAKRVDPELVKFFGRLPRLTYGVIEIPDYAAKSQTTAYYQPGSAEAGRPGYYYVNTYDLKSRPKWEMEPLSLHEAVPGHHLQIALAQELEDLPEFRKHSWFTAYGEGWALYSESLGEQMGFYNTPYSKYGQLSYEMWRAIRLVVDVGMHYKGWTRQQAIDYFMENSCKVEHDVTVEIDRYIVWPGQALAYKIGELKIVELRRFAEETLGEKFDIRAFHDEILGSGTMPLDILEDHIRKWVNDQS
jgi:uncharacterized protein (DUF885 family)